jgi:flavin reductase ActVB
MSPPTGSLADQVRDAASVLAGGVVLVTGQVAGRPWGMTATACCTVSLDPPTVLVSLGATTALAASIAELGRFGMSILSAEALALADRHARPGHAKFMEDGLADSAGSRSPVARHALAHLDCELAESVPIADHVLHIGRVTAGVGGTADHPLVYFSRSYRRLANDDLAPAAKFAGHPP